MKLVISYYKPQRDIMNVVSDFMINELGNSNKESIFTLKTYDGEPEWQIKRNLEEESEYRVVVSADSRLLMYVSEVKGLSIEDVYILNRDSEIKKITDCTNKELRKAHNLMKMYIAGAFD